SAGWLYRLIIESFLGLQREGNILKFNPCVPEEWKSFKAHYRYINTVYHIEVVQIPAGEKMTVTVDGVEKEGNMITLIEDGGEHNVMVDIRVPATKTPE
ncbi:MAG: hypothetical protein SGI94_07440, partial [Saprospiraceae bacterium]|nr:hypothetical protein [Saprospiraceae bacterium]